MGINPAETIGGFVGRVAEIEVIRQAVADAQSGRGRVLLFAGEAGIGKTSLARIAAAHAQESGMAAYWGFSWDSGGAPAYWPWTQLLRSLIAGQQVPEAEVRQLARILPEVAAGDGPALAPDQARFLLLESVRSLLASVALSTPLVLILDDLHAADEDSLSLLHHIARHAASLPVLIVGTYREIEARFSADADALWRTTQDATVLHLARLGESDVREYLRLSGDDVPDDRAVSELLRTTSGNPLFLAELVALLARSGTTAADATPLPDSVQQVIRQQLALLRPAALEVLACASLIGREFDTSEVAMLQCCADSELADAVRTAIDAGFLRRLGSDRYEFVHALYRDVLYYDMDPAKRELLHVKYASGLRELVEAGDLDRCAALARHLQRAGPEYRHEVIPALRDAAARASERLAFRDAAELLHDAVVAFGQGPRHEPADRCRLLIEYAGALLVAGEIESGHEHCREAFAIARTLDDAALMSEVALAWGGAIIVAKVDRDLVAALEESLARLPGDDAANRSLVQARLAAALQPAPDPSAPMDMARDAIALARTTQDEPVLYNVLRYGLAALMDFAPPEERIELNCEYARMATARSDVPQLFRSNLLLSIDASETGDRALLDNAIATCTGLADRIGLPHYQWRAASVRAMQATIEGAFDRACDLLDVADELAAQAEDLQAAITLSIQRFALLVEWESPRATPLDEIDARLEAAYAGGLRDAEFFIAPLLTIYREDPDANGARELVGNLRFVERSFAGGDRYSMTGLGNMALKAGDRPLAERCYEALSRFDTGCATLGLMGSCWCGPVAYWLGVLAHGMGCPDEAAEHFDVALSIAMRMNARPYIARIRASAAELARERGDRAAAETHAAAAAKMFDELQLRPVRIAPASAPANAETAAPSSLSMQQQGDVWKIGFRGRSAAVRDSKGLQMLARLISQPDTEIHVLDLSGLAPAAAATTDGPVLDAKARDQYRSRVADLQEELDEAEAMADVGRADALRGELDFITRELSKAFGLGGRRRAAGDQAERARVNVRRRIKDAVERIAEQLPDAGKYLENTIKTGRYCRYSPM